MEDSLLSVIKEVKELILQKRFKECEAIICTAMFEYPHEAIPHNLMGLMLEEKNCHSEAMKHFRAAYALNPSYKPVLWNINCYGGSLKSLLGSLGAFCEKDCN